MKYSLCSQVETQGFKGCLRGIEILYEISPEQRWRPLHWEDHIGRSEAQPSWEGCPTDLQNGYHFIGHGTKH